MSIVDHATYDTLVYAFQSETIAQIIDFIHNTCEHHTIEQLTADIINVCADGEYIEHVHPLCLLEEYMTYLSALSMHCRKYLRLVPVPLTPSKVLYLRYQLCDAPEIVALDWYHQQYQPVFICHKKIHRDLKRFTDKRQFIKCNNIVIYSRNVITRYPQEAVTLLVDELKLYFKNPRKPVHINLGIPRMELLHPYIMQAFVEADIMFTVSKSKLVVYDPRLTLTAEDTAFILNNDGSQEYSGADLARYAALGIHDVTRAANFLM